MEWLRKYTNLTARSCNTDCENIQCSRFENYSKYLKNKQIVGIVELRKKKYIIYIMGCRFIYLFIHSSSESGVSAIC